MPKDWKRRAELRRTAKRLRQLSRQRVRRMSAEQELWDRVRRHLRTQARFGFDDEVVKAVDHVIEAHVIELETELRHRHTAERVELGKLEASLDGLITQYGHDGDSRAVRIEHLRYQRRDALRELEDRDTPKPAGPTATEEDGYRHGNVGELAGRGIWTLVILYVVLVLAMVADLITFRQVVERVVNDTAVFPLVVALTVTTTYVAHRAGEAFGLARQKWRRIRRATGGWALFAVWLAMGAGTFFFRLLAPAPVDASFTETFQTGAATSGGSDGSAVLSAVLLILLYLVTGAIAVTAGYHQPRAAIAQFVRSNRRLRWAEPRLGVVLRDVAEAESLRRQVIDLRESRDLQYRTEVTRCESAARRVRAEAAILARRLQYPGQSGWLRRWTGHRPGDRIGPDPAPVDPAPVDPARVDPTRVDRSGDDATADFTAPHPRRPDDPTVRYRDDPALRYPEDPWPEAQH